MFRGQISGRTVTCFRCSPQDDAYFYPVVIEGMQFTVSMCRQLNEAKKVEIHDLKSRCYNVGAFMNPH